MSVLSIQESSVSCSKVRSQNCLFRGKPLDDVSLVADPNIGFKIVMTDAMSIGTS